MVRQEFKGFQQIKGFDETTGKLKDLSLNDGVLYFVRTNKDNENEGYLYLNGKKYGADINCGEY